MITGNNQAKKLAKYKNYKIIHYSGKKIKTLF